MKTIILITMISALLMTGCGSGSDANTSQSPVTRENAPQPKVDNDALRPPKPPSI